MFDPSDLPAESARAQRERDYAEALAFVHSLHGIRPDPEMVPVIRQAFMWAAAWLARANRALL